MADKDDKSLTRIGDLLPKIVSVAKYKPPSAIQETPAVDADAGPRSSRPSMTVPLRVRSVGRC
jgi:hypothetical protein